MAGNGWKLLEIAEINMFCAVMPLVFFISYQCVKILGEEKKKKKLYFNNPKYNKEKWVL